jgi:hypothetical protein
MQEICHFGRSRFRPPLTPGDSSRMAVVTGPAWKPGTRLELTPPRGRRGPGKGQGGQEELLGHREVCVKDTRVPSTSL